MVIFFTKETDTSKIIGSSDSPVNGVCETCEPIETCQPCEPSVISEPHETAEPRNTDGT